MKQVLIAIFAHPDDEAFGPGGTIALFGKRGWETHLICVTDGAGGEDSNDCGDLCEARQKELRDSTAVLGVKSVTTLDYPDGGLCNRLYHDIAGTLQKNILEIIKTQDGPVTVRLMTFDRLGISGHIDHITVSMITCYLFRERAKWCGHPQVTVTWDGVMFFCQSEEQARPIADGYFIYFPPGYDHKDIDESYDVTEVLDIKKDAMKAHSSQDHDYKMLIGRGDEMLRTECFRLLSE
jgi:LmbE family N-acetylglucosaminyl deacetylase